MKVDSRTKFLSSIAVFALALFTPHADAQTLAIGSATVPTTGGNAQITVEFTADAANDVAGYDGIITYDATILTGNPTIVDGAAACTLDVPTTSISVLRSQFPTVNVLGDEVACTVTFSVAAGSAVGTYPVAFDTTLGPTNFSDMTGTNYPPGTGAFTNGAIEVVAEGPPTITIDETPVVLPGAVFGTVTSDTIGVTVTPGGGTNPADTASYTCTAPAGFTVSPLTGGPIDNTGTLADIDVSCTTGAAVVNGNVECTATNTTAGSSVDFVTPVTCPAGTMAAPNLTPTPAAGGTVTVGAGAPGATACGTISIAASGGAGTDEATVTCTSGDAAVTVTPAGPLTFGVGDAPQTIQVCTTLTDTAQTFTDVITCTGDDGNGSIDWAPFSVAAAAGSTAPRFVPASSLWSKLALFGIFGALGMLIIGLRRSH